MQNLSLIHILIDDEAMQRTVESIKQLGVTNPLIARPRPDGGYESFPAIAANTLHSLLD